MKNNWFIYLIIAALIIALLHQCQGDDTVKTVTKIEYVEKTDTVTKTIIEKVPTKVYVERTKTIKGKDTIIYKNKPTDSTINANQYDTTLKSNNATADLKITTTGELLDVQGVIKYTQENKTTTITETKSKSGLFLYGQINLNGFDNYGLGLDYTIKNKLIIGTSINYDNFNGHFGLNAKIGFKIK